MRWMAASTRIPQQVILAPPVGSPVEGAAIPT